MISEDALDIAKKLCEVPTSNRATTAQLTKLRKCFPHAKIMDIIFYSKKILTPEQIVAECELQERHYCSENGISVE